jgi:hypothetical protein
MANFTVTAPTHRSISLDLTRKMFATDGAGKIINHPDTGKPVQVAQDVISGKWFYRETDSLPRAPQDRIAAVAAGAIHVNQPGGRGVWMACSDLTPAPAVVADPASGAVPIPAPARSV